MKKGRRAMTREYIEREMPFEEYRIFIEKKAQEMYKRGYNALKIKDRGGYWVSIADRMHELFMES